MCQEPRQFQGKTIREGLVSDFLMYEFSRRSETLLPRQCRVDFIVDFEDLEILAACYSSWSKQLDGVEVTSLSVIFLIPEVCGIWIKIHNRNFENIKLES